MVVHIADVGSQIIAGRILPISKRIMVGIAIMMLSRLCQHAMFGGMAMIARCVSQQQCNCHENAESIIEHTNTLYQTM
ncbi:hypothetical protein [Tautonia sociabilis]|uniref:Uncharacterized protein n=1 Tax=Tautonia sociabilis TaxID=2080755 RepID=A0A432MR91_9BACT|nr:hypothetical protein [Tautonia sociabilis]RUL89496.1 hypothetical protein TsocGM_01625 [Tautonia sociabilis]